MKFEQKKMSLVIDIFTSILYLEEHIFSYSYINE